MAQPPANGSSGRSDNHSVSGGATAFSLHRISPGHSGANEWYTGKVFLPPLLRPFRRGDGPASLNQCCHRIRAVRAYVETVPDELQVGFFQNSNP